MVASVTDDELDAHADHANAAAVENIAKAGADAGAEVARALGEVGPDLTGRW